MKDILNDLTIKLDNIGFQFNASDVIYNPMEQFVTYVSTKEYVNSKIIADLLNPWGEHRMGACFLIKFLKHISEIGMAPASFTDVNNMLQEVRVNTESFAPTSDSNGRIDILITFVFDGRPYAIIIENKLNDACDQPDQLKRYNDYVENELGYSADQRITVYMPRVGNKCNTYLNAVVINATDLAKIIDETIIESVSPNKTAIQAYSNYLKNISINNLIMDNAKKLEELTSDDIQKAKAIKDAYDKLPDAFAESLCKTYREKGYDTKIAAGHTKYCCIWNQKAYKETSLWLAVGFEHEACYFYIVSDNEDTYKGYIGGINVAEPSYSKGHFWFKPNDSSRYSVSFKGKPDTDKLSEIIDYWLDKLDKLIETPMNNENTPPL